MSIELGGRETIDELAHDTLERLDFGRVRGLRSLGDLSRFPNLRDLRLMEQAQIKEIDITPLNLKTLEIMICKNLSEIRGLQAQNSLRNLTVTCTSLDPKPLITHLRRPELREAYLYFGKKEWDGIASKQMADLGLN